MDNHEKNVNKNEDLSSLNIGSFLEIKRKNRERLKKELTEELFSPEETSNEKESPKEEIEVLDVEFDSLEEKNLEKKAKEPKIEEAKSLEKEDVETNKEVKKEQVEEKKLKESKNEEKKEKIETEKELEDNEVNSIFEMELEQLSEEFEETSDSNEKSNHKNEAEKTIDSEEELNRKKEVEEKKQKKPKKKKSKKLFVGVIICMIMDLFAFIGLFLTYGPIAYFRNMLVTSAMTTMSHKYLAHIFYSEETIEKILAGNVVHENTENTDASDINFADAKDTGEYESAYEEEILKREKNQLYKVIDVKGNGYVGYLVAIYDASRVELVSATKQGYGGAFLTEMAKKNNAFVAINASGFSDGRASGKGSVPVGTVIQDGKVLSRGGNTGYGGGLAGFNKDHILVLTREKPEVAIENGMIDAVEFGPFLIVNGKASEIKGNGGWGIAPRTVLAQRKDGIVLFLVIDGRNAKRSLGADMNELIKILTRYKAYNAVNLDGGGSSTLVVEGKLTNQPCGSTCGERYVPNAWIVR